MVSYSPERSASGFLLEMWNIIVGREAGSYGVVFGRFRCRFVHFVYGFVHPDQVIMHFVARSVHFVSEFVPFVWKLWLKRRCDSLKFQVFSTFAYDHGRQLLRWSFVDYRP